MPRDEVQSALLKVLIVNLLTCAAKIMIGLFSGLLNITADGVHSFGDSMSTVVGMFGRKLSQKKANERFPYGYRRFETLAVIVITMIIAFSFWEITKHAIERVIHPQNLKVEPYMLVLIILTAIINIFVSRYEHRMGHEHHSGILEADSKHTRSDVYVAFAVLAGLIFIKAGYPRFDGISTLVVAIFIGHILWEIWEPIVKMILDMQVVAPEEFEKVIMRVPGVRFCHPIRSHGEPEWYWINADIGVDSDLEVRYAHDVIQHQVKKALYDAFPRLQYAHIAIEPDNEETRKRTNSIFKSRDPYGH